MENFVPQDETGTLTGIPQCDDYDFRAPEIEGLENPTLNKEVGFPYFAQIFIHYCFIQIL